VQHAATYGCRGFEYRESGEAERSLSASDTIRRSDEHTKSAGKDAFGTCVGGQEGSDQEDILQEIVMSSMEVSFIVRIL